MRNDLKPNVVIDEFIEYLQNTKQYSDNTILGYSNDINDFVNFITSEKMARDILHIRKTHPDNYVSYMTRNGYKSTSIRRHLSSLNSFYEYLLSKEYVDDNYFNEVDKPKAPRHLPQIINNEEIEALFKVCDLDDKLGYRNFCILSLLYGCGLRVSELCNLEIKNIDFERRNITVFGKGSKTRNVIMDTNVSSVLKHYISTYRLDILYNSKDLENRHVFLNKNGTTLTRVGVRKILEKLVKDAGETYHISPHMIRHSFATAEINNGMDLRNVQELLGHKSLSTTQIYTHVSIERIRGEYNLSHPRASKKKIK